MTDYNLTHLKQLEAESIHIMREVAAEFDNPVMLYSIGKDSAVMLHLAIGAQDLCSTEVAKQLLPTASDAVFEQDHSDNDPTPLDVPKDYVAKPDPDQAGARSESFSLKKTKAKTKNSN